MAVSNKINGPHQGQQVYAAGQPLGDARVAMILVHGRGASAPNILGLSNQLPHPEMAYLAPQAAGGSWYPYSFLAPTEANEPGLSSGLQAIADVVEHVIGAGIPAENIILGGWSQGSCLASEFVARNPQRYGGLIVFSGGVIGPLDMERSDRGSLDGTPIFIGCGDQDSHIPVERVHQTADIFTAMGGVVTKKIYPDMGHMLIQDEIEHGLEIVSAM